MDYPTMRGLFVTAPDEERPPPPASAQRSPARRLRDAIEPLACLSIWSPEAAKGCAALGLDDYFAAYVWQRTATLGTPPTPLAVMALGVFSADLIGPQYETGAAALSSADVARVRRDAPGDTLRRVLGDIDGDAGRAVTALRRGLDAADRTARPLFTGLAAEPWPADVLAQLVHACTLLREHRGDSHLAVCAVAGLDPVEMNVLTELYSGYALGSYTPTRGWSAQEIDAGSEQRRGAPGDRTVAAHQHGERVAFASVDPGQQLGAGSGGDLDRGAAIRGAAGRIPVPRSRSAAAQAGRPLQSMSAGPA